MTNLDLAAAEAPEAIWPLAADTVERSAGGIKILSIVHSTTRAVAFLCLCLGITFQVAAGQQNHKTWEEYGGAADDSRYVALNQITKANVGQMTIAWSYPTRDSNAYACNPIIIGNTMYVLARGSSLVALDATTGKEIWVHEHLPGIQYRGLNYWHSKDDKARRLIFEINHYLEEIDARTGKSILTFGNNGLVDLRVGLGRDPNTIARIRSNTPGKIFKNLIMFGSSTGEAYMSPPGDLRAYDVLTGKMAWIFHTVPHPGELGYDTWPKDAWRYAGGTNTWGEMTLDAKSGIAYFPTGSSTYDLYGGDRIGKDLFSDCLLALNARTGKLVWYYQMIHHDLWDYDLTAAPQLITIQHDGKRVEAVAQAGKNGFLYVFDRRSGEPVWPIEERPVPKSDVPGEQSWPTQPFPTAPPPFARQKFTLPDDVDPYLLTASEREVWTSRLAHANNLGLYTPPSLDKETISLPGTLGGANWGTTAANPPKGLVYVLTDDLPSVFPRLSAESITPQGGGGATGEEIYRSNCQACHGANRTGSGEAPSLVGIGARMQLEDFEMLVASGRGDMPAFPSLSDVNITALFAYLTNPENPNAALTHPQGPAQHLGGPVVASGGAPGGLVKPPPTENFGGPYSGPPYPSGVNAPKRLYSDYGLDFPFIISPPWSSMVAYDLNSGTIQWEVPLGEDPVLAAKGIKNTGIVRGGERRGIVVTSTGLLFVNCKDSKVRAYDADTGKVLWSAALPAGTEGSPAMYEVQGREYLVVPAAAAKLVGRKAPYGWTTAVSDGAYVAFALPR
jgi:quinoprotein glucose dehydrogenase